MMKARRFSAVAPNTRCSSRCRRSRGSHLRGSRAAGRLECAGADRRADPVRRSAASALCPMCTPSPRRARCSTAVIVPWRLILTVVCALMLAIAGLGVIALTTYWVAQRRRQIGMRRALGASWRDILAYFHTENLLIAGSGAPSVWLPDMPAICGWRRIRALRAWAVSYLCIAAVSRAGSEPAGSTVAGAAAAGLSPAAAIRGQ